MKFLTAIATVICAGFATLVFWAANPHTSAHVVNHPAITVPATNPYSWVPLWHANAIGKTVGQVCYNSVCFNVDSTGAPYGNRLLNQVQAYYGIAGAY